MPHSDRAKSLKALHVKGRPLVLFNAWDAGSAKVLTETGASAIATSSWAVAAAQGYGDGQQLPLERVLSTVESIVRATDLPVTIDVEAGYGNSPSDLARTIRQVADRGAVGINLEDRITGTDSLYGLEEHCARIRAARQATSVPIFINARTDVFFGGMPGTSAEEQLAEVLRRSVAYAGAGADGLFVPGAVDEALIGTLCAEVPIPVNVMVGKGSPPLARLATLGVSRVSHGPIPWLRAMEALRAAAREVLA